MGVRYGSCVPGSTLDLNPQVQSWCLGLTFRRGSTPGVPAVIQAARNSGPRGAGVGAQGVGRGESRERGGGPGCPLGPGREHACLSVATQRSTNYRDIPEWGSLLSPSIQDLSGKKNVAFCFKDLSLVSSCKEEIKNKKENHTAEQAKPKVARE